MSTSNQYLDLEQPQSSTIIREQDLQCKLMVVQVYITNYSFQIIIPNIQLKISLSIVEVTYISFLVKYISE